MSRQSIASVSDMSISSSSASLCPQSDAVGDTYLPIDTLESSASRKVTPTEEYDSSGKDALSSAMECWSAAQAIVNDGSLVDLSTSSFIDMVEGDATIENHCTGRMADSDHFSSNMCLSDTEMPSDTQESSAPEESCIRENEEDTSAISQCNTNGAPEHPSDENNFDNMQVQFGAVQGSNEVNRLDDCCMSAISEEDVLISEQKTNIMKLPNDGMDFHLFSTSKNYTYLNDAYMLPAVIFHWPSICLVLDIVFCGMKCTDILYTRALL
jgi:hypothetical protein